MELLQNKFPVIDIQRFDVAHSISKQPALLIPKGPKYFAWFTYYEKSPICILLPIENNQIQKLVHCFVSFKEELCKGFGTILYGTLLDNRFITENIYYNNVKINSSYHEKLIIIREILLAINTSNYSKSISFHFPMICKQRFILEASNMPYQVYGILQLFNSPRIFILHQRTKTFLAKKREETEDVYELYAYDEKGILQFTNTALINDFKTSFFMKKNMFKNKHNYKNIEMSDSEDEEYLGDIIVTCIFIPEFKRWKPFSTKNKCIDTIREIKMAEKKNIYI
jgi:hypothetical protein